jgi:hypothetical protein
MKAEMDKAGSTHKRDKDYLKTVARKRVGTMVGVGGKTIVK